MSRMPLRSRDEISACACEHPQINTKKRQKKTVTSHHGPVSRRIMPPRSRRIMPLGHGAVCPEVTSQYARRSRG
eukprot:2181069-Rhodomonas_salina.1